MLKKTITYTDFNGMERTEDFYFNLTKAEIMEMQMGTQGGLAEMIEKIVQTQDGPEIMRLFKDIILKAYGEKSLDGKRFIKNDQIREEFAQTEAYSNLFMELIDAEAGAAFINAIVPADMAKAAAEEMAKRTMPTPMSLATND